MPELIIILVIALIVLGPKKLPEVAKSLGKGYREFQRAFSSVKEEVSDVENSINKEMREISEDKKKNDRD
ncbi:MAG: hypothetical protein IEMM0002_0518 [bacterium]|nr:MAG: hypothetical protein IEMM0002_0518 [bacterium]